MKPWMIWTAAAILGIGLAAAVIPWVGIGATTATPLPDTPTEMTSRPVDASTPTKVSGGTTGRPIKPPPDEQDLSLPGQVDPDGSAPDEPNLYVHADRAERAERLSQPDVVAVRVMGSRWRGVKRIIGDMPHDPAGDHTVNRIDKLQEDIRSYRRNPDEFDFDELVARQNNIIGELRQTSYWDDEMARLAESMQMAVRNYESEMRQNGQ